MSWFLVAQSVLNIEPEIMTGLGFTTVSESIQVTASPCFGSNAVNGVISSPTSIALVSNATAIWANGITLRSTSRRVSPPVSRMRVTS